MIRPVLPFACFLVIPLFQGGSAAAASPEVRRAEVAAPRRFSSSTGAVGSLGAREQGILKKLDSMSTGQLTELLEGYARMENRRMTTALTQALLKRDPGNPQSNQLAAALLQDSAGAVEDPAAREAGEYMARRQPASAARVLNQLKSSRYRGRVFPWQEDLAYALAEAGQTAAAQAAFAEILRTPGYPEASRNEAQKAVRLILVESLSKAGDAALSRKEPTTALQLAEQLLAVNPDDPDAIALRAGAYAAAGQPRRAVDYLLSLKHGRAGRFPHQMALAVAYQDARMFDDATAACQVVLTDPAATPEARAEARERLGDIAREARLTAGGHALRTGQLATADRLLAELETIAPGHGDTMAFKAAVQLKRRQYGPAREVLTKLRDRSAARGEFFGGRDELAEALAGTGSAREAAAEYALIKDDARYDTLTRYEAARRGRELGRRDRPTLGQELEGIREAEGTRVSALQEASTGERAGQRDVFLLRTAWDTVELDQSRLLRMQDSERYQVEAVWRRHLKQGFFGEVSAGGADRGAVYGASLGRYAQPGATSWELLFRGHDRAPDSLPLVALDGRQNQIALVIQRDLTDRLSLDATVQYRWIEVRGHDLGEGVNLNFNASWTVVMESPTRPELTLGYLAGIQQFARRNFGQDFGVRMVRRAFRGPSSGRDLAENLIEERFNRHGLIATLSKKFSPRFSGYLYGGMAREFEYGENEGLGGAGIEVFVGPGTTLFLNVDYSTSGRAGSRGSEVWSAATGARILF